jgi:hypothetical protein
MQQNKFKLFGLALVFAAGLSASDGGGEEFRYYKYLDGLGLKWSIGVKVTAGMSDEDVHKEIKKIFGPNYPIVLIKYKDSDDDILPVKKGDESAE